MNERESRFLNLKTKAKNDIMNNNSNPSVVALKVKEIDNDIKLISSFLSKMQNKKYILEIKLIEKITIYKSLVNKADSSSLPISNVEKIRTLRNKAVHHEFIISQFINNEHAVRLMKELVDILYKDEFIREIDAILSRYSIKV